VDEIGGAAVTLQLERVPVDACPWAELDGYADRNVFQTREWLEFLTRTQTGEIVVAAVREGTETVGWFTGMVQRRMGVRVLGSPFAGWATSYLGFNLAPGVDRRDAFLALLPFAFDTLRCGHVEIRDRSAGFRLLEDTRFERARTFRTYTVDLGRPEDDVFKAMTSACRRNVRKSEREGVVVEVAEPSGFAEEYFAQLEDVFDRQGTKPHFTVERVQALIDCVAPSGHLLLLRARHGGDGIATGIFPHFNGAAYFWGGASLRSGHAVRPNEALMWHAMRQLREGGVRELDLSGTGSYKEKYGAVETPVPGYSASRTALVRWARTNAEQVVRKVRRMTPVPPVYVPSDAAV
jgi:CelD/BcsL family acetyltransferase involved in cellulose biosynthesis